MFKVLQSTIWFRIALISAISSDASLPDSSVFRISNHSWSIRWSGSSKHEVIVSFICSLFFSTMIMDSSVLSLLSQNLSDLTRILWHVLSRSKLLILKRKYQLIRCRSRSEYTQVLKKYVTKISKFYFKVYLSSIFLFRKFSWRISWTCVYKTYFKKYQAKEVLVLKPNIF